MHIAHSQNELLVLSVLYLHSALHVKHMLHVLHVLHTCVHRVLLYAQRVQHYFNTYATWADARTREIWVFYS